MSDFLLEILSEEIPARMQDKARADLERLFVEQLSAAGLKAGEIVTYATPRRLALIARDLRDQTEAVSEELKGPRAGAPDQAFEGFLRKTGLTRDQLVERDGVFFAVIDKPGRATADVLTEAIPAIIRAFPWLKSMRWGDASISTESLRWVRPLQGIVALLGDQVVPIEIAGVQSGAATVGHRFHHKGEITIGSAADYVEKLRACHVIVDQEERKAIIRERAAKAASDAELELIEDEALVAENAGLTEWPVPMLGLFDASFLEVPPEVIQLTARVNQKYFVCRDANGKLANAFVCTANIDASDGGAAIVAGNEKVLAARLSDAKFFYDTDLKIRLEDQLPKLEQIVFHEKLGTVADKVDRVAKLARWLVEEGIVKGADAEEAERAARLAKADLVTGMVGEFSELQGLMGSYYAAAQDEDEAVAAAIRDHYKPVGSGDDVPTAPVTVAVSLADKLDSLLSFWSVGLRPTGSRDPFALRRAAIGCLALIFQNNLRFSFSSVPLLALNEFSARQIIQDYYEWAEEAVAQGYPASAVKAVDINDDAESLIDTIKALWGEGVSVSEPVRAFMADRLKVQQREAGVRHDLIDAVFALGGEDDLVRLLARVRALQSFIETPDGANLLAGYKRAANILKKELPLPGGERVGERGSNGDESDLQASDTPTSILPLKGEEDIGLSYTPENAEKALIDALDSAEPKAAAAVEAEDFEGAMAALASLRAPIDAFFEEVTVNDSDPAKREARLGLLVRVRDAVHRVADFSKIEG